ncbi:hypothetical protein SESBI_01165 [Sesbania bispinosa]|nr:hypothetical protein SESBI_01165 [Sesbania bispinosa]
MGGGGTMRTAAKIAGIGVARSGFRGSPSTIPAEQLVRNSSRPVSSAGVSSQGAKTAEVAPLHTAASWDLTDWEFADGGDLVMEAGEPMPRVVFGDVPSFQEAKEATTELKDAIEKMYLSSDSSQCEASSPGSEISVLSPTLFEPVTKSCVVEAISNPSVPNHAIQAFHLLSSSAEAQTVVASIACDPNVWKAVMQNPAVSTFFQSQQMVTDFEAEGTPEKVVELTNGAAVAGSEAVETPEKVEEHEYRSENVFDFMGILQNLKLTVTDMVSRVSSFLQNIFPTAEKEKATADADVNTKANFMDYTNFLGGTFMGLAVLVIMVVLVKRA